MSRRTSQGGLPDGEPVARTRELESFRLRSIALTAFGPSLLFGLAEGAILPVIPLSALDRGATVAMASLIVALVGIGSILSNIPSGVVTDRFGERRAMVAAALITLAGLALSLVPAGLFVFAAGVLLIGCASSVFNLARQSFLTETVPIHLRARAMSTLGGSQRIGMFVGPFLGAAAQRVVGLDGAYWVAAGGAAGAGLVALRVPDVEVRRARAARTSASSVDPARRKVTTRRMVADHRRVFLTLGSGIVLLSAVRQSRQVVIPLWAHHIGIAASTASLIYGLAGALDMLSFYPAGKLMDRRGRTWVAMPSMIIMGVALVLIPLTHSVVTLAVVSMLLGFGNGISAGIVMTLGADASPAIGRPTFLGLWRELADIGSGLGPVLLSVVTAVATLALGVLTSGVIAFAAAAALWRWTPRTVRPAATSPPD